MVKAVFVCMLELLLVEKLSFLDSKYNCRLFVVLVDRFRLIASSAIIKNY